jgi:nucleoside-diphosphate-sugar epimerase
MKILITGSSGFIGQNLINHFDLNNLIYDCISLKNGIPNINLDNYNVIIYLTGIAHDTSSYYTDEDYLAINYTLTIDFFNKFINSKTKKLIILSSIKAICDESNIAVTENTIPDPKTIYGKTKLFADQYIMNYLQTNSISEKYIYILRPCMVYGSNSKGNISLLNSYINLNLPWVFASFVNNKSLCNVKNLIFVIDNLLIKDIESSIFNIADNESYSTNQLVKLIAKENKKFIIFLKIPKIIIFAIFNFLDIFNSKKKYHSSLKKLSSSLIVDNNKIKTAISKDFPYKFYNTFNS